MGLGLLERRGQGLPGRVFASGKPEWTTEDLDSAHVRFEAAHGMVFSDDAGVLERHFPAAELDQVGPQGLVRGK